MEDKRVSTWGMMANITADGEEGQTAYVGVVKVDAPVASRASGDESVPRFNTDGTAGSTDTLGQPREDGQTLFLHVVLHKILTQTHLSL